MPITAEEISRILELVEKSSFDEIRIDDGELRIALSRNGVPGTDPVRPQPQPASAAAPAPAAVPAAPAPAPQALPDGNLIEITAPIVGIFYTASEPGAEPFVKPGQTIDAEATVGIIEVMKVFNTVPAGVSGTVVRQLVENGDFVEFGQAIFLVRPDGA
ncbi:acetyl-CoA carboxylase biotin carboxyl carrier protein [Paracoccus subflavus]|uniref:Biotin carboxyl carrier protein of acetyl-CoA carboxylase n=1 Tax=Paracoccus subflavus TaxID=2528244 RepID=A0A4Q9FXX4_9RHOB|nr:acetyl-CoA carboxylase biotin carboxyl carrier protein [Paracoccus subflavus]TBN36351.1 acetyl-CoA carboxylase biotin carboxyl carrier protein [Paracoccus subflavus]